MHKQLLRIKLIIPFFVAMILLSACTSTTIPDSLNVNSPGNAVSEPDNFPETNLTDDTTSTSYEPPDQLIDTNTPPDNDTDSPENAQSLPDNAIGSADNTPDLPDVIDTPREISVVTPIISWSIMNINDPNITRDQKAVLRYFYDANYLDVYAYDNLQRNPEAYQNVYIAFYGSTVRSLGCASGEREWLVSMGGLELDDEKSFDYALRVVPDDISAIENLLVIRGIKGDTEFIPGRDMHLYGCYQDIETYEINGEFYQLPVINISYYEYGSWGDAPDDMLSCDVVSAAARAIFGDDIKVSQPSWTEPDGIHLTASAPHLVVTLNKRNNMDFNYVGFATWRPYIFPRGFDKLQVSTDLQNYIISTYFWSSNIFRLEYYDRDFNRLWERDFHRAGPFDNTSELIYIAAGTDLYIIDVKTGEDVISPTTVGQIISIRVVEDGVLMICKDQEYKIIKTDFAGNIIWAINTGISVCPSPWWSPMQIVAGKLIVSIGDFGRLSVDNYRSIETFVISATGEVLYKLDSR